RGHPRFPIGPAPDHRQIEAALVPETGLSVLPPPWPPALHAAASTFLGGRWFGAAVDDGAQLVVYQDAPGAVAFQAAGAGDAVALYDADGDGQIDAATSAPTAPGD